MQIDNRNKPGQKFSCKVSASIITFNQVDLIRNAIEGALKQVVNFPYEIIIGDDGSTDGTREVLHEYKQKYPDLIRLNLHDEHWEEGIPGRLNNITNIRSARGKYIALCDGDDFWVSPDKIRKQAEFLDRNSHFSHCFHDCQNIDRITNEKFNFSEKIYGLRESSAFTQGDLLSGKYIAPSCSLFFRKDAICPLPEWFWDVYAADKVLQLLAYQHGPAYYDREINSCRLFTKQSVSRKHKSRYFFVKMKKTDYEIIRRELPEAGKLLSSYKAAYYMYQSSQHYRSRDFFKLFFCLAKAARHEPAFFRKLYYQFRSKVWFLYKRFRNRSRA